MTIKKRPSYQGYLDLTFAQVGMAVNVVVAKCALVMVPMYFYLGVRFCAISLMLCLLMRYQKTAIVAVEHPAGKLDRHDWFLLWTTAMCSGPFFNILMMSGLRYTTATSAGIVMSALPAMLLLFSFLILAENLNKRKVGAIVFAVLGLIVLGMDDSVDLPGENGSSLFGNFLVFLAVVPQALYSIFSKLMHRRITVLGIGLVVNVLSAIVLLPMCLYEAMSISIDTIDPKVWVLLMISVLCGTMFNWLWGRGLSAVPAGTAAVFTGVMPVATSIVAIAFLGEYLTYNDVLGMFFVLLSIMIGTGMSFRWARQ